MFPMFMTSDSRISLAPATVPARPSGLEVVMLGHCPGKPDWRALLAMEAATGRMRDLGFTHQVRALEALVARSGQELSSEDAGLKALEQLPIPISSLAQFEALFPEARTVPTERRSYLSGSAAWLPFAVEDFFTRGARDTGKTAWIVRVLEERGADGFLPRADADWFSIDPWTALGPLEIACLPPQAAFVILPDLERLQLPARLRDLPVLDVARLEPTFLPCDEELDPITMPDPQDEAPPAPPLPFVRVLGSIAGLMQRVRPDLHVLLAISFAPDGIRDRGYPAPSPEALSAAEGLSGQPAGRGLRQVQLLYPYLRAPDRVLASPCGLVAARMVESTLRFGPWVSVAGKPLSRLQSAYPPLTPQQVTALREDHGIGVLTSHNGAVELDDERLTRVAFGSRTGAGSGEVARFIGWLRRELKGYGERLVFVSDPDDPTPRHRSGCAVPPALCARGAGRPGGRGELYRDPAKQRRKHADLRDRTAAGVADRPHPHHPGPRPPGPCRGREALKWLCSFP